MGRVEFSYPKKADNESYQSNIVFCSTPGMKKSKLVFGGLMNCKKTCAIDKWCKSFDYCRSNPNSTSQDYCHLKDVGRADTDKLTHVFQNEQSKDKHR